MSVNDIILIIFIILFLLSLLSFILILLFYKTKKVKVIGYSISLSSLITSLIISLSIFSFNYLPKEFNNVLKDEFLNKINDHNNYKEYEELTSLKIKDVNSYINNLNNLNLFNDEGIKYFIGNSSLFFINSYSSKISDIYLMNIDYSLNYFDNDLINFKYTLNEVGSFKVYLNDSNKINIIKNISNFGISNLNIYFGILKNNPNYIINMYYFEGGRYINKYNNNNNKSNKLDIKSTTLKIDNSLLNNYQDKLFNNELKLPSIDISNNINLNDFNLTHRIYFRIEESAQLSQYNSLIKELYLSHTYHQEVILNTLELDLYFHKENINLLSSLLNNNDESFNFNITFDFVYDNSIKENFGLVKKGNLELLKSINRTYLIK